MITRRLPRRIPTWSAVLAGGGVLWLLAIVVIAVTRNQLLMPTAVMVGSFFVPAGVTLLLFDRAGAGELSAERVVVAFVGGGGTSILAAATLEHWLLPDHTMLRYLSIGLIEELSKAAVLYAAAIGLRTHSIRAGLVLGAAVGFGYGGFENSGYAVNSLTTVSATSGDFIHGLAGMLWTETERAVLAPVMHGLWTAIVGGVLFAAAGQSGRLRLTLRILTALALVVLLHAAWDATDTVVAHVEAAAHPPTMLLQLLAYQGLRFAATVAIAAAGLATFFSIWRTRQRTGPWRGSRGPGS